MARYELTFRPSVAKDLRDVAKADVKKILARIDSLCDDPRPPGCEKLSGQESYRLRQGNYRIVYSIEDQILVVEILKIGHRREIYRSL
ncbi:MAG: type II toxin-antitoxin system RelE/ParE family toxin [Rhodocyclaceae bacterium]|nr:type II toxin-antitoxin system RelE/ParE family toxin [Rhodocyclaceae bacterium]MBK9623215.1 type II toxin-antitoxin system RelE/ParE family toxin [Rhodocyclaceae bacterium]MBP6110708.1 type II toxin-antitoxin system RelE/ParE family toxin [Rhodocyclaceae bacterium]